ADKRAVLTVAGRVHSQNLERAGRGVRLVYHRSRDSRRWEEIKRAVCHKTFGVRCRVFLPCKPVDDLRLTAIHGRNGVVLDEEKINLFACKAVQFAVIFELLRRSPALRWSGNVL